MSSFHFEIKLYSCLGFLPSRSLIRDGISKFFVTLFILMSISYFLLWIKRNLCSAFASLFYQQMSAMLLPTLIPLCVIYSLHPSSILSPKPHFLCLSRKKWERVEKSGLDFMSPEQLPRVCTVRGVLLIVKNRTQRRGLILNFNSFLSSTSFTQLHMLKIMIRRSGVAPSILLHTF